MATETSLAYRIHLHERGTASAEGIKRNLKSEEIPKPQARAGQVLVRMKAAALNYRDLLVATDDERYGTRTVAPLVPLCDGAGVVESVNAAPGSSSRWRPGDRVIVAAGSSWKSAEPGTDGELDGTKLLGAGDIDGVLQQYIVADEDAVVPAPEGLSFEEAAPLGGAYVSAWNALFGWYRPLKAGDVVVIQGTGGVSIAVLQIATAAGARVIALSSSPEKLEVAKRLGAAHGLDSNDPEWDVKVRELTGGRGADHVVDVVGASTIVRSLRATRKGGLVTAVGFLGGSENHDLIPEIVLGAKTVRGIVYASIPMLENMSAFFQKHAIKPVLGHIFEWTEASEAYAALLNLNTAGKVVIRIP
ncbi:alcohol dehydrogenase [Diaporthe eres]|uniref:Enoyl reductase (ER) domain-containing protein n=1 Tax=Diaporthe vaccinii TaxID=105482 RepID=A0ABR4FGB2_9PEZI|nr:alcohol dehydrogenase [Diaporthe eres]